MLNVWINLSFRDTKSTIRYHSLFSMCIIQRVMDIKYTNLYSVLWKIQPVRNYEDVAFWQEQWIPFVFASSSPPLLGQDMVYIRGISYISVLYGKYF